MDIMFMKCFHIPQRNFEIWLINTFSLWKRDIFIFLYTLTLFLLLLVTYTTNEPFPWNQPIPPTTCLPRHQFLSSHCSHFPERFQGIIALTNHPLGSGAHEIDVPSFQNNGGALWGASWCHNFSSWQAGQVYFGPRMGTGPMKIQSGQLNQSLYRVRWQDCSVSSHQTCSITFSVLRKLTAFTWKTRPPYLPRIE